MLERPLTSFDADQGDAPFNPTLAIGEHRQGQMRAGRFLRRNHPLLEINFFFAHSIQW